MEIANNNVKHTKKKKDNFFLKVLKMVFVTNIGCKVAAIIISVALWMLLVGLGII